MAANCCMALRKPPSRDQSQRESCRAASACYLAPTSLCHLQGLRPGQSLESSDVRNPEMFARPGCVSPLPSSASLQDSGGIIS